VPCCVPVWIQNMRASVSKWLVYRHGVRGGGGGGFDVYVCWSCNQHRSHPQVYLTPSGRPIHPRILQADQYLSPLSRHYWPERGKQVVIWRMCSSQWAGAHPILFIALFKRDRPKVLLPSAVVKYFPFGGWVGGRVGGGGYLFYLIVRHDFGTVFNLEIVAHFVLDLLR